MFDGRLDIAAGRMNVENDFASSPLYCNYMNNVLCGDPKALPGGDIGHSAYPDGVWGGRVRVRPTPDHLYRDRRLRGQSGSLRQMIGAPAWNSMAHRTAACMFRSRSATSRNLARRTCPDTTRSASATIPRTRSRALSAALPTSVGAPASTHTGNTQVWVLVDQMLLRQGAGDQDGIIALGGFVHNDPENSVLCRPVFRRRCWTAASGAARPQDTVALLFTYNTVSGQLGKVQAQEQELGLPFSNGATGVQTHEMILEVNYNIHVYRGVNFQPDFQYVFRPNAEGHPQRGGVRVQGLGAVLKSAWYCSDGRRCCCRYC